MADRVKALIALGPDAKKNIVSTFTFKQLFEEKKDSIAKLSPEAQKELKKLDKDSDNKGLTIVPLKLYTNEKGFAKVEIALCRGKKNYDKRETMKENDTKRDIARIKKEFR